MLHAHYLVYITHGYSATSSLYSRLYCMKVFYLTTYTLEWIQQLGWDKLDFRIFAQGKHYIWVEAFSASKLSTLEIHPRFYDICSHRIIILFPCQVRFTITLNSSTQVHRYLSSMQHIIGRETSHKISRERIVRLAMEMNARNTYTFVHFSAGHTSLIPPRPKFE